MVEDLALPLIVVELVLAFTACALFLLHLSRVLKRLTPLMRHLHG